MAELDTHVFLAPGGRSGGPGQPGMTTVRRHERCPSASGPELSGSLRTFA
jgi:hypothetical protein